MNTKDNWQKCDGDDGKSGVNDPQGPKFSVCRLRSGTTI